MQALADPRIAKPAAGVVVAIPTLLWVLSRFGGYAGLLKAEKALEMLERENSVLVDIRWGALETMHWQLCNSAC